MNKNILKIIWILKQHQSYDFDLIHNDITLLILENEVDLSEAIQTACLPPQDPYPYVNMTAYIAGWGSIQNYSRGEPTDSIFPDILQNLKIKVLEIDKCASNYPLEYLSQFCAGIVNFIK